MGWRVNYVSEARVYGKYLRQVRPDARIAVLYQHDDVGKDYLRGLREGLGERRDHARDQRLDRDSLVRIVNSYFVAEEIRDQAQVPVQQVSSEIATSCVSS